MEEAVRFTQDLWGLYCSATASPALQIVRTVQGSPSSWDQTVESCAGSLSMVAEERTSEAVYGETSGKFNASDHRGQTTRHVVCGEKGIL